MLSISEDPERALFFQPHNVKPLLHRLIFSLPLSSLQPTFYLSCPGSLHPHLIFLLLLCLFLPLPLILLPSLHPDAAEESKAEEATPADAAVEATESKDD